MLIYGVCDEQYKKVWDYTAALKFNPRSSTYVQVQSIDRLPLVFQRFYVCMKACKEGFKRGFRLVIGVDGCHLKGAYPGQCLVAWGKMVITIYFPLLGMLLKLKTIIHGAGSLNCC